MPSPPLTISPPLPSQLKHAADIKEKIDELEAELANIITSDSSVAAKTRKKNKMSAATQRVWWAKVKGAKPAKTARKKGRKMSAATRAKMAAVAKAPWAKAKVEMQFHGGLHF